MDIPKPGVYRHFKNKRYYRLHGLAKHSETMEDMAVYEPLYVSEPLKELGGRFWVRPLAMFTEEVEYEGIKQPRFHYVGEEKPQEGG